MNREKRKREPRKREPRKVKFAEAIVILIIIVAVMVWGAMIAKIPTAMGILYCAALCAAYGAFLGYRWEDMFENVLNVVKTAMPALYFLMLVGFVSAAWIASGTIPYLIFLGLKIIHPSIFLFAAMAITAIAAMATGSSWAIVTSLGLAMGGIGTGLGIPMYLTAGAVVSGCFLGDKWSPLSDTPNLAAASTGQNIIRLFTHMIPTSGLGAVIGGLIFLLVGFGYSKGGADTTAVTQLLEGLDRSFNFNLLLLLPIVFVFVMAILKFPILPALVIGIGIGMAEAVLFQGKSFRDLSGIVWNGYVSSTGNEVIDNLLTRGGAISIAGLVLLLFAAFTFAGIIERIGILDAIMDKLLVIIKGNGSLVTCTVLTSMLGVFLSSSVYVSMILNGRMYMNAYKKRNLDIINLSRAIDEGAAYMGGMCPWSGGTLLVVSSLGISAWAYFPFVFSAWASILLTIIWGYMGKFTSRVETEQGIPAD